jgi:glycerate-2-kinase
MSEEQKHIIKNYSQLATSAARQTVLAIAERGLEAINTRKAVEKNFIFEAKKQQLKIFNQKYDIGKFKRIVCIGFGKAALEAVTAIQQILKDRITCGYVLDLKEGSLGNIICRVGTHPLPTKVNIEATEELVAMLETCGEEDLVICVVSGGGSALLCKPHEMSCETEVALISALTVKGATIAELNTVRKHISSVKGGNLAKIIYPATCISLIFSDVPGDDISMVASGPTVKDTTSNGDAAAILQKYDVLVMCHLPSCRLLETPKDNKYFANIHNILFVSSKLALEAMSEKAEDLGLKVKIFSHNFQGLAEDLAGEIVAASAAGICLIGAGESTVKIVGSGKGGRNLHMALAALPQLKKGQVFLPLASDGRDNAEAAGAIADSSAQIRAAAAKLDASKFLANNDSFTFFEHLDDLVMTGPTGSNISDFFISYIEK